MTARVGLMDIISELGVDGVTYAGLVRSLRDHDPARPAARCGDARVSYGQLADRVDATAGRLQAAGVAAGDRVAVMLPNSIDTVVVHLAIQRAGAVGALVNTALVGDALQSLLVAARPLVVVATPELVDRIATGASRPAVLSTGEPSFADALGGTGGCTGDPRPNPLDAAFINYTSGTTGQPKGVVLKHMFSAGVMVLARRLELGPDERIYLSTPMYHALGLAMTALGLRLGGELVIAPRFSASGYWDDIRDHDCSFGYHVGTMARMLHNQPPRPTDGVHRLRVFIGGGMPPDIWEDFAARFKVRVIESYSASDGVGALTNWGDGPVGSFGRAEPPDQPEIEVRVVDAEDRPVPPGTVGEMHLRPGGPTGGGVLVQYDNDDAATDEKNRGGWVRTGDLVRQDPDGWLFFVDRMKDVIRRRGVNIAPAEIERIVARHPKVGECAALAVPSELGEDDIKLVVVGSGLGVGGLAAYFSAELPDYMRPRYVELVDELPKTITERVQRYKLKGGWRTPGTWDLERGAPVAAGP